MVIIGLVKDRSLGCPKPGFWVSEGPLTINGLSTNGVRICFFFLTNIIFVIFDNFLKEFKNIIKYGINIGEKSSVKLYSTSFSRVDSG